MTNKTIPVVLLALVPGLTSELEVTDDTAEFRVNWAEGQRSKDKDKW